MIRREYPNYTADQVLDHLAAALGIVADLDPDAADRPIVLSKAIDLLAAKQIVMEQPQMGQFGLTVPRG